MEKTPKIDVADVTSALAKVDCAEKVILAFAQSSGLPIDTVSIYEMNGRAIVRLSSYRHRLFKNSHTGRRDISETSVILGSRLWEVIEESATAYKTKRKAA